MWIFNGSRRLDRLNQRLPADPALLGRGLQPGPRGNDAQKTMGVILALLIGAGPW